MNKKKPLIIGLTGTFGAGKGAIVDYLVKNYKFDHYSVKDYLIEKIRQKELPVNRDSMVKIANEIRKNKGPSFIVDELLKKASKEKGRSIIESIRNPFEAKSLKNKSNFYLLSVDADPKIRYKRMQKRQSEKDNVTYDEFLEKEKREMKSKDKTKQNISEAIAMADFALVNNKSLSYLYRQVDNVLEEIEKEE